MNLFQIQIESDASLAELATYLQEHFPGRLTSITQKAQTVVLAPTTELTELVGAQKVRRLTSAGVQWLNAQFELGCKNHLLARQLKLTYGAIQKRRTLWKNSKTSLSLD